MSAFSINVQNSPFNAKGDGIADDTAALQAAFDAGVETVLIPPGTYVCSAALLIRKPIAIIGAAGSEWYCPSIFQFGPQSNGLIIQSYGDVGGRADWTILQSLAVKQLYNDQSTQPYHGITLHAPAKLRDVWVNKFSGDGIHIEGSTGAITPGNPNIWSIFNCQSSENLQNGLYVAGSDSNAGVCILLNASANHKWGIWDNSALGNTYGACHTRTNGLGGYQATGGVNYSMFLSCYTEGDEPSSVLNKLSHWIGGTVGRPIIGGNKWLPGQASMYLKQNISGEIPLRVVGTSGSTGPNWPLLTIENENEGVQVWIDRLGMVYAREGALGFGAKSLNGAPIFHFDALDSATGYNASVGDIVCRTSGGGYGQGNVVFRNQVIDPLTNLVATVDALTLQAGKTFAGKNGLVLPSLTTAQKLALPSPAVGTLVFDTTLGQVQVYNGSSWIQG